MAFETIDEAFSLGWPILARSTGGKEDNRTSARERTFREELDVATLVWIRGRTFPLSQLGSRFRYVVVLFQPSANAAAKR